VNAGLWAFVWLRFGLGMMGGSAILNSSYLGTIKEKEN